MSSQTVWILGSGFSKPLGGPLLNQLLSEHAAMTINARHRKEFRKAGAAYQKGINGKLWDDAEAFLETLDLAYLSVREGSKTSTSAVKISAAAELQLASVDVRVLEELRHEAYQMIALQCQDFVDEGDIESETWAPYVRWATAVWQDNSHSILSFNYDCVLEKLGFEVPVPGANTNAPAAKALKLHGSVSWTRKFNGSVESYRPHSEESTAKFLCSCNGEQIGIAVPGRTKSERVGGPLAQHWDEAKRALSCANSIVFIGYRFPPSDSYALLTLLDAIRNRAGGRGGTSLHVVLGPDINHPDVKRLAALLTYTMASSGLSEGLAGRKNVANGEYRIQVHPLWAQDFLALWQPDLTSSSS